MNNKKIYITIMIIGFFIVSLSLIYFLYLQYKKEGGDEVLMFDNSKSGKWIAQQIDKSLDDSTILRSSEKEICLSEEMINSSRSQKINSKLGLNNLDCSTIAKREGKNNANFLTSCTGLSNNEYIGLSVEGKIESFEDYSIIETTYTIGKEGEPFKFKRVISLKRVSDCDKK